MTYRPQPEPAKLAPVKDNGAAQSIDQLVAAGRRSSTKRVAALANRITEQAGQLRAALEAEREHAEIARQVARLERELAAAKAKLKSGRNARAPERGGLVGDGSRPRRTPKRDTLGRRVPGEHPMQICPDCGQSFAKLGVHRARKHGYRRSTAP